MLFYTIFQENENKDIAFEFHIIVLSLVIKLEHEWFRFETSHSLLYGHFISSNIMLCGLIYMYIRVHIVE